MARDFADKSAARQWVWDRLSAEGDEGGTLARLKAIRAELLDPTIAAHNGRLVKTTGDGLLVEFGSVVDALHCATGASWYSRAQYHCAQ